MLYMAGQRQYFLILTPEDLSHPFHNSSIEYKKNTQCVVSGHRFDRPWRLVSSQPYEKIRFNFISPVHRVASALAFNLLSLFASHMVVRSANTR
jgi:hypothetical protein